ncbi:MAG: hypothetical protein ABSG32_14255 [Terriglobia bacterium]
MSFQEQYQILSAQNDGECRSFRALQIASGQPVLIHHLDADRTPPHQPDLESLIFKFLRGASAEERQHFLDMGDDEGRVFVVTADVPECQDLRHWLQSVTGAQAGEEANAQPAEISPDAGNLEFTQNFSAEGLRSTLPAPASAPVSPSPGTRATQPAVPPPEKGAGVLKPPPQIPVGSSEVTDPGPTDLSGLWEKSAPASPAGLPASIAAPPTLPESPDGPSEVPEVTAEFLARWSSPSAHDAPAAGPKAHEAQGDDREPPPSPMAPPTDAQGNVDPFADLFPIHAEVMKPPLAPSKVEISNPTAQLTSTPAVKGPGAKTPRVIADPLVENNQARPQAAASASSPSANDKPDAPAKMTENVPRRRLPPGFEVVYQSSKARSRPIVPGLPDQSGIPPASPPIAPPGMTPPAGKLGGGAAIGFPSAPEDLRRAAGAIKEPAAPPSPPQAQPAMEDLEQTTLLVRAPLMPTARPASPALPSDSASIGRATPSILAPKAAAPNRSQPDEYTRLFENIRPAADPLPLGVPPAGHQPATNLAVPAPAPASYLGVPPSQTSPYHGAPLQFRASVSLAHNTPSHSADKKRKIWVPILILSSLFLMTVALVLFFVLKH